MLGKVMKMCGVEKWEIGRVERMGMKPVRKEKGERRGRLIKVTCKEEGVAERMMRNKHKLRDLEGRVFIQMEMTKEEQEENRRLRWEMWRVRKEEGINCYIKYLVLVRLGPFLGGEEEEKGGTRV